MQSICDWCQGHSIGQIGGHEADPPTG